MIRAAVEAAVRNLNMFPATTNGVSASLSPRTILTGRDPPDYNKLPLEFGEYVEVHDEQPVGAKKTLSNSRVRDDVYVFPWV